MEEKSYLRLNPRFPPLHAKLTLQLVARNLHLIFQELEVSDPFDVHRTSVFATQSIVSSVLISEYLISTIEE